MVPFLLIFQACVTKYLRQIKINAQNLKPFFDKLQGCFKDQYRWCAAFYFLSRLLILVLDTYITRSPLKRAFLEGACVLILTVFVYLRPYKEGKEGETSYDWINISDAVLLSNLTVIAIFSSVIEESASKSVRKGVGVFINVLAYVPFVFLLYVSYKAIKGYRERRRHMGKKFIPSAFQNVFTCNRSTGSQDGEGTHEEPSGGTELA
ncbi:uncharacterized protein LOC116299745 [Actinia tenebrosa]|uniref:Uncharacterized protein LOC116299745 n=1 Tax=Actinia tenebrosa TaxID=6105 RepID=A0A6P8IDJ2_ACTTE|nr:uncharacterized protein LOC116299745 [Actinia tenebrosa]